MNRPIFTDCTKDQFDDLYSTRDIVTAHGEYKLDSKIVAIKRPTFCAVTTCKTKSEANGLFWELVKSKKC